MPVLGMVQDTGKIVRWLKSLGEPVRKGEIIMEVETDKAVQELEAPASGILAQILAKEGDEVPVTQVVAVIMTPGEYQSTPIFNETGLKQPVIPRVEAHTADQLMQISYPGSNAQHYGRILASPKARRCARETHQNLGAMQGSGPDGAILARDLESVDHPAAWGAVRQLCLHRKIRVTQLLAWHTLLQQTSQQKIIISDLLVFIVSRALIKHPRINMIWQNKKLNSASEINISLAVALENGLVVPVIHHADRLSISEIANERDRLTTLAQNGKLRLVDISGGTFSIYNLEIYGVDSFDGELNDSQTAMLMVGRITEQVIPVNGAPVIQPIMNVSVSIDQSKVDVVSGAKFIETLADMLEEPLLLLS